MNSCKRYINPCKRYINSFKRIINPCKRIINPCKRHLCRENELIDWPFGEGELQLDLYLFSLLAHTIVTTVIVLLCDQ